MRQRTKFKKNEEPEVQLNKTNVRILKFLVRLARPLVNASRYAMMPWVKSGNLYFTNGHYAVRLPQRDWPDCTISPDAFDAASQPTLRKNETGELVYAAPAFQFTAPLGNAPNVDAIIERTIKQVAAEDSRHSPVIDPKYLLEVAKLAVAANWKFIQISIPAQLDKDKNKQEAQPVYFQQADGYKLEEPGLAIIMPIRL